MNDARNAGIMRAGLLTCASLESARLPIPCGTVVYERVLGAYSGGAVLDSHQLPKVRKRSPAAEAISDYQNRNGERCAKSQSAFWMSGVSSRIAISRGTCG